MDCEARVYIYLFNFRLSVCMYVRGQKVSPWPRRGLKYPKWADVSPLFDAFNAQWRLAFAARRAA